MAHFAPINGAERGGFTPVNGRSQGLADEIVVGSRTRGSASAATSAIPRPARESSVAAGTEEQRPSRVASKKRKSLAEAEPMDDDDDDGDDGELVAPAQQQTDPTNFVPVGVWRESTVPNQADKHAVVAYVDRLGRLQHKILDTSRDGVDLKQWPAERVSIAFGYVAFDEDLVDMSHQQIKEFVRIRSAEDKNSNLPEETRRATAIHLAKERSPRPTDLAGYEGQIAYGATIPAGAHISVRPEPKKEKVKKPRVSTTNTNNSNHNSTRNSLNNSSLNSPLTPDITMSDSPAPPAAEPAPSAAATPAPPPAIAAAPQQEEDVVDVPAANQPADQPAEPTRILLGHWKFSSEEDDADKHAVMGVLGTNNQLRPRLVKHTRDGRPLQGNFPQGAGAIWMKWDEFEFEPHLRGLTRLQLKEYVRIRQRQIQRNEGPDEVVAHELAAVNRAKELVPAGDNIAVGDYIDPNNASKANAKANKHSYVAANDDDDDDDDDEPPAAGPKKKRPRARLSSVSQQPPANRPRRAAPTANQIADRAMQAVANHGEIINRRNSQRAAVAAASPGGQPTYPPVPAYALPQTPSPASSPQLQLQQDNPHRAGFSQAVGHMQRNWAAQAEDAVRAGVDREARVYLGTRYEYRGAGDFEGMYATPGQVITVGDEEYVENRVLRKVERGRR